MSNYYTKQEAKVRIAHELMSRGWNVEGYHADESDIMTDYWSPAHWGGIATKNGYVLVVDNRYAAEAKEITKYNPAGNLSFEDREKIIKLEAITTERGATEGEEENAKALIGKIQSKTMDQPAYEVVGMTTAHMGNPKGSIWHIEKDGKIYDKGNALTKFADVPESWEFDIIKMEYTDRYKKVKKRNNNTNEWEWVERKLPDETRKIINDFKTLILRFERVVNGMNSCGDGTKETEEAAQEQQGKMGYEEITITEYKTEIKANEIEKPEELKDGMYFKLKVNFTHGKYKGIVYKINSIRQNPYNNKYYVDCNRLNKKLNKVLTGLASQENFFHCELEKLEKWINEGSISVVELSEVNTPYEVKKWVKIDKSKNTYNNKPETKQEEKETKTEEAKQEKTVNKTNDNITIDYDFKIIKDIDTRDNSDLWVLKLNNKISYDEFCKVRDILKPVKGNYSKFKSGFIFRYDPTSILKPEQQEEQTAKEVTETENNYNDVAENIIDISTEFITELNISGSTICNNDEYLTKMFDYIKTNNITITVDIINYLKTEKGYDNLIEALEFIQSGYYYPIKDGFIYDCHFKEWDMSITEIQKYCNEFNIPYYNMDCKIGFTGLTAEQARQVKEISNKNGSIFFIDAEKAITADNSTTKKQPESEEVTAQQETETNNTINFEEYKNNNEVEEMETNNNSNDFNFDDIMNQFDNIEINNNSRISADDEKFCKKEQEQYAKAVNTLNKIKEVLQQDLNIDITADRPMSTQQSNNSYLDYYSFRELTELFSRKKDIFIHNIITYFTNKYKITIDSYKVCDKYKKVDVDYNILLDEIFLQLGGFSFNEKALTEIKDALHKKVNKFNIEIKGNKIIFTDIYIRWGETTKYEYIDGKRINTPIVESGYHSGESFKPYLDAFSWFEYGKVLDIKPELRYYQISITPEEFKNGVMIGNKVEKIKFFKNGRMDVTFKSSQHARQFAKEYCGYIEKSA